MTRHHPILLRPIQATPGNPSVFRSTPELHTTFSNLRLLTQHPSVYSLFHLIQFVHYWRTVFRNLILQWATSSFKLQEKTTIRFVIYDYGVRISSLNSQDCELSWCLAPTTCTEIIVVQYPSWVGVKGSEKREEIGYCGPGWRTHVCDAAHDYFNYLILFTNYI